MHALRRGLVDKIISFLAGFGSRDGRLLRLIGPSKMLLAAQLQRHTVRFVSDFIDEFRFSGRGGTLLSSCSVPLVSALGQTNPAVPARPFFSLEFAFFKLKYVRLDTPVTPATFSLKHTFRN
jgi:hypothetical protein